MAALLPILIAAAVVPTTPVEPNTWFTSKDHPKTALQVTRRGQLDYAIDVAPDGTAIRCDTPVHEGLDKDVCEIVMKRARFQPAKDDQGNAAFARHDVLVSFLMPGSKGRPDRSKLTVKVDSLPAGVASPAYAKVAFMVDANGAISQCASTAGERRRFMQTVEALGPAACEALAKDYRPTPARNAAGAPVASVQSLLVKFETK
ncbi:hypothetical protein [Sphingomonas montanisoli]|uniref:TonB family protein n=1 Tax=Sphingomonas montanisoli TaxID=2606412 RepID=A0A5D9CBV7_9SPHN|nr:hypothetical protein [Sphingomonas montanisoli]TZG28866.1 hypothetical protein FYJ91_01610 [Sphingomonas montanisoli]